MKFYPSDKKREYGLINQLLDEPYFDSSVLPTREWVKGNYKMNGKDFSFLLIYLIAVPFFTFEYNGQLITKFSDLTELFENNLLLSEHVLLNQACNQISLEFYNLSLTEKCEINGMNDYLKDRNVASLLLRILNQKEQKIKDYFKAKHD